MRDSHPVRATCPTSGRLPPHSKQSHHITYPTHPPHTHSHMLPGATTHTHRMLTQHKIHHVQLSAHHARNRAVVAAAAGTRSPLRSPTCSSSSSPVVLKQRTGCMAASASTSTSHIACGRLGSIPSGALRVCSVPAVRGDVRAHAQSKVADRVTTITPGPGPLKPDDTLALPALTGVSYN